MTDLRNKALELINAYGDREALSKIEKLLGLREGATLHQIASQLEVSVHKLKYLYTRNCQLEVQKQKRIYAKQAEVIQGRTVISERNKFEIWLPIDWRVMDDHKETYPLNFGLNIGLFSASPVTEELPRVVEVTKFQLKKPMTPRELYYVEKAEKDLAYGGRIGTLSLVNGLKGIISHGVWRGVDPRLYGGGYGEAFLSTHFTWGQKAWAIDCWSNMEDRLRVRPLFKRIIASFHPTEVKIQSTRERQI